MGVIYGGCTENAISPNSLKHRSSEIHNSDDLIVFVKQRLRLHRFLVSNYLYYVGCGGATAIRECCEAREDWLPRVHRQDLNLCEIYSGTHPCIDINAQVDYKVLDCLPECPTKSSFSTLMFSDNNLPVPRSPLSYTHNAPATVYRIPNGFW